jgi:hypothetical protein
MAVNWIHLAQDTYDYQTLVNMAMNTRVAQRWEIHSVAEERL